jgi:WD40 repeat protein
MALSKVRAVLALAVVLGVLAAGAGLAAHQVPGAKVQVGAGDKAPPAAAGTEQPRPEGQEQVRGDLYGDPLPPGALVRMGTVRLRHSYAEVVFGADSKTLISVGGDGWDLNVRFWEAATGKQARRIDLGARRGVRTIAADGKTVAVAEESKVLHVWEAATGKEIRRIPVPPGRGYVNGIALAPDGRAIATASYTEAMFIQVWETTTGSELWHLEQKNSWGGPLFFSPDGKTLMSVQGDALILWDTSTGKERCRLPVKAANSAAFSPDGTRLASVVGDGTVTLWDARTGKELATFR